MSERVGGRVESGAVVWSHGGGSGELFRGSRQMDCAVMALQLTCMTVCRGAWPN